MAARQASSLASALPLQLIERVRARAGAGQSGEHVESAVLFADVYGFTGLAESLAQEGIVGAEHLSQMLNAEFAHIIDSILDMGGQIATFPGDAVIAIWPAGVSLQEATEQALHAAQAIQARAYQRLKLRVGVGAGRVWVGLVGGVEDRFRLCIAGSEIIGAATGAAGVPPGGIALTDEARRLTTSSSVSGVRRIQVPTPDLCDISLAELRSYVPRSLLASIESGVDEWVAEFRHTSIAFTTITGVDLFGDDAGTDIQRLLRAVQREVYLRGGSVNQLVHDDKGLTVVSVWGVPGAEHEDDARRALAAAEGIVHAIGGSAFGVAVGVTSGVTFCGMRGSLRRREYAVVGDRVNVAARLAQAAGRGVLVDAATMKATRARVSFGSPRELTLKGRSEPVLAYPALGALDDVAIDRSASLVGRQSELALLRARIDALQTRRGGLLLLEGEAGIGKSWLLRATREYASDAGFRVLHGTADSIDGAAPYTVWRPIVRQVLRDWPDWERGLPELIGADALPLLGIFLPGDVQDTDATRHLAGTSRVEAVCDLLTRVFRARLAAAPALISLDDAHALDSASWALARAVRRALPEALLLLGMRPTSEDSLPREGRDVLRDAEQLRVVLGPLAREDVRALVESALGVTVAPPQAVELIYERSRGHPLISEQLALALRDVRFLQVIGDRCLVAPETPDLSRVGLPNTIEGIVARRLDELPSEQRACVKAASVLGASFDVPTLLSLFTDDRGFDSVYEQLEQLVATRLLERTSGPGAYAFKHALTREAAYARLPFAQRRDLHGRVARHLEAGGEADPSLLSYHFQRAEDGAKACSYAERAGAVALRAGAYREAVELYRRALDMADPTEDSGSVAAAHAQRATWECQLGIALYGLGSLPESRQHLRGALELAGFGVPRSRAAWGLQLVAQLARQVTLRLAPGLGRGAGQRAEPLALVSAGAQRLAENYMWERRQVPMLACTLLSVNAAERAGRIETSARSYAMLGFSLGVSRLHGLADAYFSRAEATAIAHEDLPGRVFTGYSRGVYLIGIGRWAASRASIEAAIPLSLELGDAQEIEMVDTSLANLEFMTSELRSASRRYKNLQAAAQSRANLQHEAWGLYGDARSLVPLGELELAERQLHAALTIFRIAPESISELICHGLLADVHLERGEIDAALSQAAQAMKHIDSSMPTVVTALQGYSGAARAYLAGFARELGRPDQDAARARARQACGRLRQYALFFPIGWPRAHLAWGCYLWLSGKRDAARRRFAKALRAAERLGMPYETALAHQYLLLAGGGDAQLHAAAMTRIFQQIGAVRPTPILGNERG
jgi:class 3 adenylate cyclase/tetratricopeptide (TPR) repeat protein